MKDWCNHCTNKPVLGELSHTYERCVKYKSLHYEWACIEPSLTQTRNAPRSLRETLSPHPRPELLWDNQSTAGLWARWLLGPLTLRVWGSRLDWEWFTKVPSFGRLWALPSHSLVSKAAESSGQFCCYFIFSRSADDFRAKVALCFGLTSLESCLLDFGPVIPHYLVVSWIIIINILFGCFAYS